jgi:hypothetical protein
VGATVSRICVAEGNEAATVEAFAARLHAHYGPIAERFDLARTCASFVGGIALFVCNELAGT